MDRTAHLSDERLEELGLVREGKRVVILPDGSSLDLGATYNNMQLAIMQLCIKNYASLDEQEG